VPFLYGTNLSRLGQVPLTDLMGAMAGLALRGSAGMCKLASCRAVSVSNSRLVWVSVSHCLVERYSSVDWSVSFSVMWRNSFMIGRNSVVYQSAPVVDLCCRLFPVGNAPRRRSVHRTPAVFSLNPVSDESLDPDDHPVRICFPQLFSVSSSKTNWRWVTFFTQRIQITTRATFDFLASSVYLLTRRDVTHQIGCWLAG